MSSCSLSGRAPTCSWVATCRGFATVVIGVIPARGVRGLNLCWLQAPLQLAVLCTSAELRRPC